MRVELQGADVMASSGIDDEVPRGGVALVQDIDAYNLISRSIVLTVVSEIASPGLSFTQHGSSWETRIELNPYRRGTFEVAVDRTDLVHDWERCRASSVHQLTLRATYQPGPIGPKEELGNRVLRTLC